MTATGQQVDVWIGTDTTGGSPSRGVYHLTLDDSSGVLSESSLAAEAEKPGFLARHPKLDVLYSTSPQGVVAWRIVRSGGGPPKLEKLNERESGDGSSTHVSVDPTGGVLLSAQYGGGSVASYPLKEDGSIGMRTSLLKHDQPSGVVADRQDACHPHSVFTTPDNRYAVVPDLGADRVFVHKLDPGSARLMPHGSVATPAGSGPRHLKFHPSGKWGYVVNELAMSVTALAYNADAGELTMIETVPTLSQAQIDHERSNTAGEIRVHPTGRFLYASNRGHDSVTVFAIDDATGKLKQVQVEPIRGSWPRNFGLSPSGKWLLAAGADSHTVAAFEINPQSGALQFIRQSAYVPSPICVEFE